MNKQLDIQSAKNESSLTTSKANKLYEMIRDRSETIAKILPDTNDSSSFVQACMSAIMSNPKLQACQPMSIMKSVMESARYGLEPNSPLSHAALIPFGDKVQFIIEYRGLLKLAWNSGIIKSIDYDKICKNDSYIYTKGYDPTFQHVPQIDGERGDVIAYYAVAETLEGGKALVVMKVQEIVEHGKRFSRSFSHKDSPWVTDFDAMAFKTVIRQLLDKKLPKSATPAGRLMQEAAHIEDLEKEKMEVFQREVEMEIVRPHDEVEHEVVGKELRPGVSSDDFDEIQSFLDSIKKMGGDLGEKIYPLIGTKTLTPEIWSRLEEDTKQNIYETAVTYDALLGAGEEDYKR
jgi:recombination protein RecT|tara:strand:- start:2575 stop:3615 length:1041 start_codon:yes stop_codon:yes gene_type:complete